MYAIVFQHYVMLGAYNKTLLVEIVKNEAKGTRKIRRVLFFFFFKDLEVA